MSRRFSFRIFSCCSFALLMLGACVAPLAIHAQSRSAANQFNSTTVNDQVNLQVLDAVVTEMSNSFNRSCSTPSGNIAHGQSWTTTICPFPTTTGQITYVCISGYNALQSSTCN